MGMVMYVRSGDAAMVDALVGDDDALVGWVTDGSAWEADKMWWAAADLLFGPGGVGRFGGEPVSDVVGYTPVLVMDVDDVAGLAADLVDVDLGVLIGRFDADAFGDPVGPSVSSDDRDWLPQAADRLRQLIVDAAARSHLIAWVVS
ncbi:MAG: hypothetical protein AB7N61_27865 [Acidimicrobiia bacterium]